MGIVAVACNIMYGARPTFDDVGEENPPPSLVDTRIYL